jgi:hypothetical protein
MYKTFFWISIVMWIILGICILRTGEAFVPRVEKLEQGYRTLNNLVEVIRTQLGQVKPRIK